MVVRGKNCLRRRFGYNWVNFTLKVKFAKLLRYIKDSPIKPSCLALIELEFTRLLSCLNLVGDDFPGIMTVAYD